MVEVLGWDEAFLGVETDDPEAFARDVQRAGRARRRGLDCTVGIGENKLQAKIATGFGKPAGVFRLTGETWFEVLGDRPTDALWGIGRQTAAQARGAGHPHGPRAGGRRPRAAGRAVRPDDRAVAGPARSGRRRHARCTAAVRAARRAAARSPSSRTSTTGTRPRRDRAAWRGRWPPTCAADGRAVARVVVKIDGCRRSSPGRTAGPCPPRSATADAIEAAALEALGGLRPRGRVRLIGVRAEFA